MQLAEHAWPEIGDYFEDASLALVPVGSTEQHGPHLPEGTDHLIATAFARTAADRTGYLCTPPITVGVSPHHRQFHGTMWADAPAFREYVRSVTSNLAYQGVDRVVFVNAHGGNVEHLREVGRDLRDAEICYAIEWMWNESIRDMVEDAFEHPGPHGGPKETALIQHLHPELVHDDRLEEARDGGIARPTEYEGHRRNGARIYYDAIENTANGVLGDQTEASAAIGAELFSAATEQLVHLCEWLADQAVEDLLPDDHVRTRATTDG